MNFSSRKSFTRLDRVYRCRAWEGSIDVWGRKFLPLVGSYFQLGSESIWKSIYTFHDCCEENIKYGPLNVAEQW